MAANPEKIGKYHVLGLLGRGGMGAVYKAEDKAIGRLVAIKVLLTSFDDDEMLKRFYSEARSTGKLQHANIVTLYDLGETDGSPYLVMQFLEGESLDKLIASPKKISLLEVVVIVRQVCAALHYAHEHQIIHRDVKPANVVLLPDGNVKLVDFGIAKFGNERHTRTGMAVGSVNYMSPEQISGTSVDRRSDVYSAGVLFFELLTRRPPYEGDDIVSTIHKVLNTPIPDIAEIVPDAPPRLSTIMRAVLAKDPASRYQTAEEFSDDLLALQEELQGNTVHEQIRSVKEAIAAKDWALAADRLSRLRRVDLQNKEARELSREIRIFSVAVPTEDRIRSIVELATQARGQHRYDDVLRLCALGLEIDTENATLLQLAKGAYLSKSGGQSDSQAALRTPAVTSRSVQASITTSGVSASSVAPAVGVTPLSTGPVLPANPLDAEVPQGSTRRVPRYRKPLLVASLVVALAVVAVAVSLMRRSHDTGAASSLNQAPVQTKPQTDQPVSGPATNGGGNSSPPATDSSKQTAAPAEPDVPSGNTADSSAKPADQTDAAEWQRVRSAPTLPAIDRFVTRFPQSSFRPAAEAMREDLVWNKAQQGNSIALYDDYLAHFPVGKYAGRARENVLRIDQQTVENSSEESQLVAMLNKYPAGDMHGRIVARMDDLAWAQSSRDPSKVAEYLRSFPSGRHATEARNLARPAQSNGGGSAPAATNASSTPTSTVTERTQVDDKALIQRALLTYEQAYNRQDVEAIAHVWPTIPSRTRKNMEDSFKKMKSTHLTNEVLSESINGNSATLRLSQTLAFSTGGSLQSKSDKVTMELRKGGAGASPDSWYIDSVR